MTKSGGRGLIYGILAGSLWLLVMMRCADEQDKTEKAAKKKVAQDYAKVIADSIAQEAGTKCGVGYASEAPTTPWAIAVRQGLVSSWCTESQWVVIASAIRNDPEMRQGFITTFGVDPVGRGLTGPMGAEGEFLHIKVLDALWRAGDIDPGRLYNGGVTGPDRLTFTWKGTKAEVCRQRELDDELATAAKPRTDSIDPRWPCGLSVQTTPPWGCREFVLKECGPEPTPTPPPVPTPTPPPAPTTCPTVAEIWEGRPRVDPPLGDRIAALSAQIATLRLECPGTDLSPLLREIALLRGAIERLEVVVNNPAPCSTCPPTSPCPAGQTCQPKPTIPPPPPPPSGLVHVVTEGAPQWERWLKEGPGSASRVALEVDFTPSNAPDGAGLALWLNLDGLHRSSSAVIVVFVKGRDGMKVRSGTNVGVPPPPPGQPGEPLQREEKPFKWKAGTTYHIGVTYDAVTNQATISVSGGGKSVTLNHPAPSSPSSPGKISWTRGLQVTGGHPVGAAAPEVPWGIGTKWADLKWEVRP